MDNQDHNGPPGPGAAGPSRSGPSDLSTVTSGQTREEMNPGNEV